MNTFIGMMVLLVLGIMFIAGFFRGKEPVRDGNSSITYDDYLLLMDKLEQMHEAIEEMDR